MKTVYVRTKTKDEARKRAEWLYMILRDCTPVIADLHTSKAQVATESMLSSMFRKTTQWTEYDATLQSGSGN